MRKSRALKALVLWLGLVACSDEPSDLAPPIDCPEPTVFINGRCEPPIIIDCAPQTRLNEVTGECEPFGPCAQRSCDEPSSLPPGAIEGIPAADFATGQCACIPTACASNFILQGGQCVPEITCPAGYIQEAGQVCVPDETVSCFDAPSTPSCIPTDCAEQPTAADGTNLVDAGLCVNSTPVAPEGCTNNCHNGTEDPHPWFGGPNLSCTGCHGGNATAITRMRAHVALPEQWQTNAPQLGRPNLQYYLNYITFSGVENFVGGLEWLRFRNPGDLRVADATCGQSSGCHQDRVENVKRSVMATGVGLVGVSQHQNGIARSIDRGELGVYKWDTTYGMTPGGPLEARAFDSNYTGSVERLDRFTVINRELNGLYNQVDLLRDTYDKECGVCHLGHAGQNNRYGDFRSSGCSACHMPYALDGRSRSQDQMINKLEPTYPAAYTQIANVDANDLENRNGQWSGPERAHPLRHVLSRQMASRRCGTCHSGSNRTDWQFRGYQIDPNRTVATSFANGFLSEAQFQFTDELDNTVNPFTRYHGLAQDQVLAFVDWNNDGFDDIPADIHFDAGLQCMDCHTTGEMHNELKFVKVSRVTDWDDPAQVDDMSGAIWSHQDQSTEIECIHCHGNLEYRALSYLADNRNPVRNMLVCPEPGELIADYTTPAECEVLGSGRWTRSKFNGSWHYTPQVYDTVLQGGAVHPNRDDQPIYTLNASIFHGRFNPNPADGAGPCPNGDINNCFQDQANNQFPVTQDFSHLGGVAQSPQDQHVGGLECYTCHATWANMCVGCHLGTRDVDGTDIRRDFSPSTGELTLGEVFQADVTYIGNEDMQFMVNSEGKISQAYTNGDVYRHIDFEGKEYFGSQVVVNNDANILYNMYRHVSGYGLYRYDVNSTVGLPPDSDGFLFAQFPQMDNNAGQGYNQMMPHTVQRSHPRMDCEYCHIDVNTNNTNAILARYAINPTGFGNVSAYLAVLGEVSIVRNDTNDVVEVDPAAGYRFDANIDPVGFSVPAQMDWKAFYDSNDTTDNGFPLSYSNHPCKESVGHTFNGQYVNPFPNIACVSGAFNQGLINKLTTRIFVQNEGVSYRGVQ